MFCRGGTYPPCSAAHGASSAICERAEAPIRIMRCDASSGWTTIRSRTSSAIASWTPVSRKTVCTRKSRRGSGPRRTSSAWYQRSEQQDVRGYKDLWGGLGRLRSDFDPQELQLFYARYERLGLGRLDWLSGTFSVNAQRDGSVRQNLRPTDTDRSRRRRGRRVRLPAAGRGADRIAPEPGLRRRDLRRVCGCSAQRDQSDRAVRWCRSARSIPTGRAMSPAGCSCRTRSIFCAAIAVERVVARLGGRYTHVGCSHRRRLPTSMPAARASESRTPRRAMTIGRSTPRSPGR